MLKWYVHFTEKVRTAVDNEKGAVSMEWIMIGLLAVAVVAAIITALEGRSADGIATAIINKLADFINKIGG
ncbi:Flp pilus assembly pilin Flp [Caldalkalibacillus uzonensis]|uniref:Flp pilus assembly pilin Flp n=1 Tax=Caldalkalibacillus uzonensis TaxID=353224 RepID=A0ABU0CQU6_9BACI|nr:hypothetical protein [Caldalkalibacillus uzonensis]MDQ0337875.1 Flp pilus assembly pilin Flp [Caldalkalibacillus uzonensis]